MLAVLLELEMKKRFAGTAAFNLLCRSLITRNPIEFPSFKNQLTLTEL